jgi:hypothetical protein
MLVLKLAEIAQQTCYQFPSIPSNQPCFQLVSLDWPEDIFDGDLTIGPNALSRGQDSLPPFGLSRPAFHSPRHSRGRTLTLLELEICFS